MAPRKLSDSDKKQIAQLYCQPGETTSTLADRFGVSSSTVSRVLKQMLSDADYNKLMQWKRGGERGEIELFFDTPIINEAIDEIVASHEGETGTTTAETSTESMQADETPVETSATSAKRRSRRRSTAQRSVQNAHLEADHSDEEPPSRAVDEQASSETELHPSLEPSVEEAEELDQQGVANSDVAAWVSEGLEAAEDYEEDDDDDDDDDWEDDEWEDDSEDEEEVAPPITRQEELAILSFEDFEVTKPCYLVVDRLSELITCPLREFAELGLIPTEEEQARTLPVFDNHRVARRFARRNQRIIKVPNGLMLNKTQEYLQAKGITRLLFDGQVYALSES